MIRTVSRGADDGYLNKLVKYVPVEGLAVFLPIATMAKGSDLRLWITFILALVAALILIAAQARKNNESTRLWYWPFVIIGFGAWSVGASDEFRELLGLSVETGKWILAVSSATIPIFDTGLELFLRGRK